LTAWTNCSLASTVVISSARRLSRIAFVSRSNCARADVLRPAIRVMIPLGVCPLYDGDAMQAIADAISVVRKDLDDLEQHLPYWDDEAHGLSGSRKYRAIADRIVDSAKRLKSAVKENTFSKP